MNRRLLARSLATVLLFGSLLSAASCATTGNTLAQDLAYERWEKCRHFPGVELKEIRQDGQIWLWKNPSGTNWTAFNECLRKAATEQAQRGASAGVVPTPAVSQAGEPSSFDRVFAPVLKRGDEWAFRWESPQGKGTYVWSVDRTEVVDGTELYVVKAGATREIYWRTSDLAYVMEKVAGAVEIRDVPPSMRIAWPLTPGKTWEYQTTREHPRERSTNQLHLACRAADAEELVTVSAGRFMTLKVVCDHKRTGRFSYEVWYAPEVRHWVRERAQFSYGIRERELIRYKLR